MTLELPPRPVTGRTFHTRSRVRLSDTDASGRLRLDAIARYLQDAATDDVAETGWGAPEHLWVVRRIELEILTPFSRDEEVDVVTWSSGQAAIGAARRWSLNGDAGGHAEVDSVWIHLGPDARPARIEDFGVYAESTGGRRMSTKLVLPDPPADAERVTWPLRVSDVDVLGHVNNAAYWQAVEHELARRGPDPGGRLHAMLDYRHPLDLSDAVELAVDGSDGRLDVGFVVGGDVRAVARVKAAVSDASREP